MTLRRPLVPLCAVTILATLLLTQSAFLLFIPIFCAAVFFVVFVRGAHSVRVYGVLSLLMVLLSLYPVLYEALHTPKRIPYSESTEYRGTVTEVSYGKYATTVTVRLTSGAHRGENCGIRLKAKEAPPTLFETIRFHGNVLPSEKVYDKAELCRLYAKNVRLCTAVLYDWTADEPMPSEISLRQKVYFRLRRSFSQILDGDTQAMALALLTGDRTGLSSERTDFYRRAGLYPFLCISGIHVMLTAGLLRRILNVLHLPPILQILILFPFLFAFALIGGTSGSVLRACLMAAVLWLAPLFSREYDSVSSLCFAYLVLWLFNPYMLFDLGTALSFDATLGIVLADQLRHDMPYPGMGKLFPTLAGSVYASGFTALLCMENIGGLSLLSPFSNLLAGTVFVPVMTLLLATAVLCLLPNFAVTKVLLSVLSLADRFLLGLFETIAKAFSSIKGSYAEVSPPALITGIVALLCIFPLLYALSFAGRKDENRAASVFVLVPYGILAFFVLFGGFFGNT